MSHEPHNSFIDKFNPAFWVASHLSERDTYVVYRLLGGNIHQEIKVWVVNENLNSKEKLTPAEQMYFKKNCIK